MTAATVHPDGALLTRSGRLPVDDGRVRIDALPLLLDEGSLRASLDAGSVLDLRVDLDTGGAHRGGEPEAVAALWRAEDAAAAIDSDLRAVDRQRGLLSRLVPSGPGGLPEEAPVPSPQRVLGWRDLAEPARAWAADLDERRRVLRQRRVEAKEAVRLARSELENLSPEAWWSRWRPHRVVTLRVDGDAPEVGVTLTYRVEGALWTPAYVLETDASFRTARLVIRALVAQATGEDWRGVALALSTAPCARRVDLPELPALRLGLRQPAPRPAWRELPPGLDDLFPPDLPGGAPPPPAPAREELLDAFLDEPEPDFADEVEDAPRAAPRAPMPKRAHRAEGRGPPQGAPAPMMRGSAAPPPPPQAAMAMSGAAPTASTFYEKQAPRRPPPPSELEAARDVLDYARLRLHAFEAGQGRRGRLYRIGVEEEAGELGVPAPGRQRLDAARSAATLQGRVLRGLKLPPHHVLPGPIEGIDFAYACQGAADVRADGRLQALVVQTVALQTTPSLRAVPRADPRAFRTLEAQAGAVPLLPGPVEVLVDGELVQTLAFAGGAAGGALRLDLGAEDRLEVVRNVRYREESAGMFGGSRRLHTTVEVEVASGLDVDAEIELLDRIPVAGDDEVQVAIVEERPVGTDYEGEPDGPILKGGRRQLLAVPARGTATAVLHYTVTLGSKLELQGGDRRG